jgi:ribosomal protein L37E
VMSTSARARRRPVLDEATFEQLLAAAFVLQQHNDSTRANHSHADPAAAPAKFTSGEPASRKPPKATTQSRTPTLHEMLAADLAARCHVCGRQFVESEEFCGSCGLPREEKTGRSDLQSKWASMWYMQQARESSGLRSPFSAHSVGSDFGDRDFLLEEHEPADMPGEMPGERGENFYPSHPFDLKPIQARRVEADETEAQPDAPPASPFERASKRHLWETISTPDFPAATAQPSPSGVSAWQAAIASAVPESAAFVPEPAVPEADVSDIGALRISEAEEPDWREGLRTVLRVMLYRLSASRAVPTLALVSVAVMLGIGLWTARPIDSREQLTWLQSLMIKAGVAEPPPKPKVYFGRPDARVWVDVHTGLYYCPESELYGTTPGGHFTKQRVAQQDQFQPSMNLLCE